MEEVSLGTWKELWLDIAEVGTLVGGRLGVVHISEFVAEPSSNPDCCPGNPWYDIEK